MRRALAAVALVAAVGIVIAVEAARVAPVAPVSASVHHGSPPDMPDAAAIDALRANARIGAQQARTLRAAVRRCRGRPAPGPCVLVALEHAAAGAKLNAIVLRAVAARLRPGPCMTIDLRLAGLASTIAYLAVEGVRSMSWPGATWAAAGASVRAGARIIAVYREPWPRRCAGAGAGLRA
jgi:hypothetical protein